MREGLSKEIVNWEYLASILARGDDEEQARFFKAFIAECNTWGTRMQVQQQLAYVNMKLNDKEKEIIGMLGFKE